MITAIYVRGGRSGSARILSSLRSDVHKVCHYRGPTQGIFTHAHAHVTTPQVTGVYRSFPVEKAALAPPNQQPSQHNYYFQVCYHRFKFLWEKGGAIWTFVFPESRELADSLENDLVIRGEDCGGKGLSGSLLRLGDGERKTQWSLLTGARGHTKGMCVHSLLPAQAGAEGTEGTTGFLCQSPLPTDAHAHLR